MAEIVLSRAITSSAVPRIAEFVMTDATDANLTPRQDASGLHDAQQSVMAGSWSWVRQVHSDRVVTATEPGGSAGSTGDALCTSASDAVIAIQVADCVPVGLVSSAGAIAVVHAGWRGALLGVIEAAVRALQAASPVGDTPSVEAVVGPHICAACYEFGADDLQTMVRRFGDGVVGKTSSGTPALDMTAVVTAELARLNVPADTDPVSCTACSAPSGSSTYWSHRARAETQRQSLVGVLR